MISDYAILTHRLWYIFVLTAILHCLSYTTHSWIFHKTSLMHAYLSTRLKGATYRDILVLLPVNKLHYRGGISNYCHRKTPINSLVLIVKLMEWQMWLYQKDTVLKVARWTPNNWIVSTTNVIRNTLEKIQKCFVKLQYNLAFLL